MGRSSPELIAKYLLIKLHAIMLLRVLSLSRVKWSGVHFLPLKSLLPACLLYLLPRPTLLFFNIHELFILHSMRVKYGREREEAKRKEAGRVEIPCVSRSAAPGGRDRFRFARVGGLAWSQSQFWTEFLSPPRLFFFRSCTVLVIESPVPAPLPQPTPLEFTPPFPAFYVPTRLHAEAGNCLGSFALAKRAR